MAEAKLIYKIISRSKWEQAESEGVFDGAEIDLADGYIHFSTAEQAAETAAKHFAGQEDLLLVAVSVPALGQDLKWEESRGGALFPHLYGQLKTSVEDGQVRSVHDLRLDENGAHVFPEMR